MCNDETRIILDEAEAIMHGKGVKAALEYLETVAGMKAPKRMCVCESKQGHIILLGTPCKDTKTVQRFYKKLGIPGGIGSYAQIKASCSGNYVRSE